MTAVDTVENTDAHHAARSRRRAKSLRHLLGAIPDLHYGRPVLDPPGRSEVLPLLRVKHCHDPASQRDPPSV
ncbi:hypothetical protein MANAM107_01400 [Actinomyces capricornis]|uniref:Uncharacterized protein n=1 Tax=Actinomyces capricornis TaxID=2755559 RepID=A0ABN6K2Y2_9ACTO|nr:hypothetical protein MANAM107_01400 [Actinomyces capricornis]